MNLCCVVGFEDVLELLSAPPHGAFWLLLSTSFAGGAK